MLFFYFLIGRAVVLLLIIAVLVCLIAFVLFAFIIYKLWNGRFDNRYTINSRYSIFNILYFINRVKYKINSKYNYSI